MFNVCLSLCLSYSFMTTNSRKARLHLFCSNHTHGGCQPSLADSCYTHDLFIEWWITKISNFCIQGCCCQCSSWGSKAVNTVWEKETRDRIKVLETGLGDSRPLGSRALFHGATSLLFSVLVSRKYLLCCDKIRLLCPWSHLSFYWSLWTTFAIFLYRRYHPVGGHTPAYAGRHLGVCTSSVVNLCWPSFPRSTPCFS